nr:MAG TPA: hypothetical protein [Caudoviricetes sp.]
MRTISFLGFEALNQFSLISFHFFPFSISSYLMSCPTLKASSFFFQRVISSPFSSLRLM